MSPSQTVISTAHFSFLFFVSQNFEARFDQTAHSPAFTTVPQRRVVVAPDLSSGDDVLNDRTFDSPVRLFLFLVRLLRIQVLFGLYPRTSFRERWPFLPPRVRSPLYRMYCDFTTLVLVVTTPCNCYSIAKQPFKSPTKKCLALFWASTAPNPTLIMLHMQCMGLYQATHVGLLAAKGFLLSPLLILLIVATYLYYRTQRQRYDVDSVPLLVAEVCAFRN